ncbi:MAG TPA: sulfur oxidation c-type cytochrome SoxA [Burkholderiaceae bacterium]|nr:sulfur oxidation c-type cytochrome SoxA [Burkholderiaceae bacterium]
MRPWFATIVAAIALGCVSSVWAQASADTRRSGFDTMSPRIQSMQRDDLQNPGMLWVADGEVLWKKVFGISFSCAHCHNDARQSMKGVAAKYPDWDPIEKRPVNLSQRINLCRTRHQLVLPLPPESVELLGLEAYVAHQSRGMPLAPSAAKELAEPRERGRKQYEQRIGQLNLSCAQCHDQLPGKSLAGSSIPEGHVNGYPTYRLEWQGMGSLQRRLRNCLSGVRAEPPPFNSIEMVELELYLAQRSAGMKIETPAVRP